MSATTAKWNLRVVLVASVALFILSLFYLSHVYACLTLAFVLAYLLDPVVAKLEQLGLKREWGVPMTLVVVFSLLILAGVAIIPKIVAQGHELMQRLPTVYYSITGWLAPASQRYLGYNVFQDVDKIVEGLGDPGALVKPIGGFVGGVFSKTFKVVTTLLGLLVIPLMSYYLLRDFSGLYGKVLYLVPKRHHKLVTEIRARLDGVLGGFVRGQLVVSTILSIYYGVAFAVLRLELAVVLGLMAGFFNVVPYIGIISVLVLTLLIAVIHGAGTATFVGIGVVFALGMAVEGSLLTPRIVGRRVGLTPLTLIVALMVGAELLGLVGMLLAVPIAAMAKVFLDVVLAHYRDSETYKRAT